MKPLISRVSPPLRGICALPGDKSISHRAVLLGMLAVGETRISGLLEGEDVLATAAAARTLGAEVIRHGPGEWSVHGVGLGGLAQPKSALDMGNSGTACRLLMGVLASHPVTGFFIGDHSLSARPMRRVIEPLAGMGADIRSTEGRLPLSITGLYPASAIEYRLPVASAQVKSALLLAGLNAPGDTIIHEPWPTRDHSERMLKGFGANIAIETHQDGRTIRLRGEPELHACRVEVPGDPSSAAFMVVAATIIPGSEILIPNVGINPTRTGLFEVLAMMGADLEFQNRRDVAGEPVADIKVRAAALHGVEVPPEIAPRMIDEYPILAVAAAGAEGKTRMTGIGELRVKETDRIAAMAAGLRVCGVKVEEAEDEMIVEGGASIAGGATVISHYDHRIAMSFAVLGAIAAQPITIDDAIAIATSFPDFVPLMRGLGADLDFAA